MPNVNGQSAGGRLARDNHVVRLDQQCYMQYEDACFLCIGQSVATGIGPGLARSNHPPPACVSTLPYHGSNLSTAPDCMPHYRELVLVFSQSDNSNTAVAVSWHFVNITLCPLNNGDTMVFKSGNCV